MLRESSPTEERASACDTGMRGCSEAREQSEVRTVCTVLMGYATCVRILLYGS